MSNEVIERYIWDSLMARYGNPYGVAGLMGNLKAESNLNPINLQNSGNKKLNMTDEEYTSAVDSGKYSKTKFCYDGIGYGLAQWTARTRKTALYDYLKALNLSIGDINGQVQFLIYEIDESFPRVADEIRNAEFITQASNAVLTQYEKPKAQSDAVKTRRASYGMEIFKRMTEKKTEDRFVRVNRKSVNVRKGPGVDYASITYGYKGDLFPFEGQDITSGWYCLKLEDGAIGWVTNRYTSIVEGWA